MFTGIVEEKGALAATSSEKITLKASKVLQGTKLGDSIAVNGVCLTVSSFNSNSFTADVMPETLRRSNLGLLKVGDQVNLERAALVGGRIGGHNVQGHIDGTGIISALKSEGNAVIMTVDAPIEIMQYIVPKCFIAVDGVSLTVSSFTKNSFNLSLVFATRNETTLGILKVGNKVNLEADIIGKYVKKYTQEISSEVASCKTNITSEFLLENGF